MAPQTYARLIDMRIAIGLALMLSACASEPPAPVDPPPGYPQAAAETLQRVLFDLAAFPQAPQGAGYRVFDLGEAASKWLFNRDYCDNARLALQGGCWQVLHNAALGYQRCEPFTDWVVGPRCAARIHLAASGQPLSTQVLAFDVTDCQGVCQYQPFNGCEKVIERYFSDARVAFVDASTWTAPRTQLMWHPPVTALATVDEQLCDRARTAAENTCSELVATMPFVARCRAEAELLHAEGDSCAVRFSVGFSRPDTANAIFTTQLDGLLSFDIH